MTYNELQTQVAEYLDYYDDELMGKIPNFIGYAEKEAARVLRLPSNERLIKLVHGNQDGISAVGIPEDFVEVKDMFVMETCEPIKMTVFSALMRKKAGIDKSTEGSGRYYARLGNQFFIYPCLHDKETVLMNYYSDPKPLEDGNDTNYLLTIAPELLLYLALKHAMIFLKNEEEAGKYNQLAQNSLEQIRFQIDSMDNKPKMLVVPRRMG